MPRPALARLSTWILALLVTALMAGPAFAGDERGPDRPVPDYDGRGEEPTDAGDVLLWVPRIIVSPLYFTTEFVLRRPLGFLISEAEEAKVPAKIVEFLTWDDGDAGIVPTFLLDFGLDAGFLPSFGIYHFWDDFLFEDHDIRLRLAYGGTDWVTLDFTNRYTFKPFRVSHSLSYSRRRDWVFAGIGGGFGEDDVGRYGEDRFDVGLQFQMRFSPHRYQGVEIGVFYSSIQHFEGDCCGDRSMIDRVLQGKYALPDGYTPEQGPSVKVIEPRIRAIVDTRAIPPENESGVRVGAFGRFAFPVASEDGGPQDGWVNWGGQLGLYWDVWKERVLSLQLFTAFADPLGDDPVPFFDLAELGGDNPLVAFIEGQLRDRSAVAATLEWRYPIWVWLDGTAFVTAGNVFGARLEDFTLDGLRLAFGMGMKPSSLEDHPFELMFAFGTDTFAQGLDIVTFRVVLGTTSGF